MHFSYNNFALPRCHKFRHENGAKNIWLQRCFFGLIYLLKLDYLVQMLMDRVDISRHDLSKCQLSEIFFFVSLRLHTEVRRAFIKWSCTFLHFRPLVRFFYGAFRPNFIPKKLSGTTFHALSEYRIQTHYS